MEEDGQENYSPEYLHSRFLFQENAGYLSLSSKFAAGAQLKEVLIDEDFDWKSFREERKEDFIPLFLVNGEKLEIFTADDPVQPVSGQKTDWDC